MKINNINSPIFSIMYNFYIILYIEIILLCIFIGYILGGHILCSCSKISMHEGFSMLTGADVKYKMGSDISKSWEIIKIYKIMTRKIGLNH